MKRNKPSNFSNTTDPKHAIIYARVSSRKQEDNTSLTSQARECKRYANEHGLTVLDCFSDVYSGASLYERPRLNELRTLVRAGRVGAVICYATDRLSRNIAHLAILIEEAERWGVTFHFVTEPLDRSPEGMLLQSIRSYVAEVEREKIRERTQRGIHHKLQSGKLLRPGSDIYGYRFNAKINQREICEAEAAIVRDMFDWYLREQLSVNAIAKRLNASGVSTPNASKGLGIIAKGWYSTMVNLILRREEYTGRTFAGKFKLTAKHSKDGNLYLHKSKQSPRYTLPESITPAIIPREQWERVQKRLDTNSGETTRNAKRLVILRGMIVCEKCKLRLIQVRSAGKPYYRCETTSTAFPTGRCRVSIRAEKIEQGVWQEAVDFLQDQPALVRELTTQGTPVDTTGRDIERLRKELQKLAKGQERMLRLLQSTDDESLAASIHEQLQEQTARRVSLENELAATEQLQAKQTQQAGRSSLHAETPQAVKEFLASMTDDSKRKLLESLGVHVTLHPEKTWSTRFATSQSSAQRNELSLRHNTVPTLPRKPASRAQTMTI